MACVLAEDLRTLRVQDVARALGTTAAARQGRYGEVFARRESRDGEPSYPQCDASEFFVELQGVLREGELARLVEHGGVRERAVGVLGACVFNVMTRSRLFCERCKHVSDTLGLEGSVALETPREGKRTLEELLRGFLAVEGLDSKCARCCGAGGASCGGTRLKQVFIEEEPEVLVLILKRQYQVVSRLTGRLRTRKSECLVEFPERLRRRLGWAGLLR